MMPSNDGKGRTIWQMITGTNLKDNTPLELKYYNPLSAKVKSIISFNHEPNINGINFTVEKISVYKTTIAKRNFFHTDYHLKGLSLDNNKPLRMRLRLLPDEDVIHALGHKVQLLYLYYEMPFEEHFFKNVLGDKSGKFLVHESDDGKELEEPRVYWRVGSTDNCLKPDPYKADCTILADLDSNGSIEEDELEKIEVTYWEFSRLTDYIDGQEFEEFLTIEMNRDNGFFTFLRGQEIEPSQIEVF